MFDQPTVLILGAGASCPSGFPTGQQLKVSVESGSASGLWELVEQRVYGKDLASSFSAALRGSGQESVDSFLERNPDFQRIGKESIAGVLLRCESRHRPGYPENRDRGCWYEHLFRAMQGKSVDSLSRNRLSILTFNYDRSLEHSLYNFILNSWGCRESDAAAALSAIPIVHLYGSLGPYRPLGARGPCVDYGAEFCADTVRTAASFLKIMPEDREGYDPFERAREILADAERVFFLGFGYDPTNMHRLGLDRQRFEQTLKSAKLVAGTAFGKLRSEIQAVHSQLPFRQTAVLGGGNQDIITFLRDMFCSY